MSYRFVRCQTHPKCPDTQGWYLILEPGDLDTLEQVHRGVVHFYYYKFGLDPHIEKSELALFYNPIRLGANWLQTVEKFLFEGTTLAVNPSGGVTPLDSMIILAEIISEELDWPNHFEGEIIKISRWPKGQHYYLTSNKNRVFIPPSHKTYEQALRVAKKYTFEIRSNC